MKAIMISIKPKWVAKILNGEKTIEIRKTMPNCDLPVDVYIYCTKDKEHLYRHFDNKFMVFREYNKLCSHNGKVVAKFTLNNCLEWHNYSWRTITKYGCVSDNELREYSKGHKSLYIWHIYNLEIFDEPKELNEFYKNGKMQSAIDCKELLSINELNKYYKLTKAPQSMCYVEAEELE